MTKQLVWMVIVALVSIAFVFGAAPVAAAAGPLDGRSFSGKTGVKGEEGDPEDFEFDDGEFDPLGCHEWGFYATPYEARSEDGKIHFVAEHTNEEGDRMKWEGTVSGDTLEGRMWYWHGDDPPQEYWFAARETTD